MEHFSTCYYLITFSLSCPVCNQNLDEVGDAQAQEAHVRACLEGGSGTAQSGPPQPAKYLVYRLPAESALLGVECALIFSPMECSVTEFYLQVLSALRNLSKVCRKKKTLQTDGRTYVYMLKDQMLPA